jgi:fused signal recognition particle receptor
VIKHDYGADAAAVAFDAISYAKAHGIDAVLVDTAGRMHTHANLMREMEKICRVTKPNLKIFVGESIVGNDMIEQAKSFSQIGVDAIILSKADVDEKGGAAISVSYVIKKPILFFGVGQKYEDLESFDKEKILGMIGL